MVTQRVDGVHGVESLRNIGIDKNFITQHAGSLNSEFERIYNDYPVTQRLAHGIIEQRSTVQTEPQAPQKQAESEPAVQSFVADDANDVRKELQNFAKNQADRVESQVFDSMNDLASQFTQFAQKIEARLDKIEKGATQAAVVQPAEAPKPQKVEEAQHHAMSGTDTEKEKLKEMVAIDKIFDCTGKR